MVDCAAGRNTRAHVWCCELTGMSLERTGVRLSEGGEVGKKSGTRVMEPLGVLMNPMRAYGSEIGVTSLEGIVGNDNGGS